MLPRAAASAERINEVLDVCPDDHRPGQRPKPRGATQGHVEFQNVTFQYPGRRGAGALGRVVHGAAGRSDGDYRRHRLRQVHARRADPALLRRQRGARARRRRRRPRAAAGGPARPGSASCRRRRCSFPARSPATSALAAKSATDDEVRHAAAVAQAAEFIDQMPEGYARRCRRAAPIFRAARSSGWRSRARSSGAPEIYVFDDSFSALDFATDARLRAALKAETHRCHGVHRVAADRHRDERRPHCRAGRGPGGGHRHARRAVEELRGLPRDRGIAGLARGGRMSAERAAIAAAGGRGQHVRPRADGRLRHAGAEGQGLQGHAAAAARVPRAASRRRSSS